jgi:hypothetical protein
MTAATILSNAQLDVPWSRNSTRPLSLRSDLHAWTLLSSTGTIRRMLQAANSLSWPAGSSLPKACEASSCSGQIPASAWDDDGGVAKGVREEDDDEEDGGGGGGGGGEAWGDGSADLNSGDGDDLEIPASAWDEGGGVGEAVREEDDDEEDGAGGGGGGGGGGCGDGGADVDGGDGGDQDGDRGEDSGPTGTFM